MDFSDDHMSMCGAYCGDCEWREGTGCPGCQASKGQLFWGVCKMAACALERGHRHCGQCDEVPCRLLQDAFADPEHGDRGERLANLKAWAAGERTFLPLTRPQG